VLTCRVEARPAGAGTRLTLTVEAEDYRLNRAAVAILAFGAAGAIAATLWPFFPQLLSVAPLAVVLALCAWFLVAARVRTTTAAEFLELVVEECGRGA
jgi:membrane protein implicated in regulation of membrane protease activity